MKGPPLGPGGDDITWPNQVAPRGRKASSTRKIKPQTSNRKKEPSTMVVPSKTEDYHLLGDVLDQGLKELGYSREDLNVKLFASDKQHVLDLYCRKGKNCCYKFYWSSFGIAYGNPRFSELGKVLTKVALERSRMVLCFPDWGAHGGNEYWRTLLD